MILHLLFPDKFGEYAMQQFSGSDMHSEFVIVADSSVADSLDIRKGTRIVYEDQPEFNTLLNSLYDYNAIILHGLFYPWQERVLRAVPKSVKVAWVFWGGDIYGRNDIQKCFLSSSSKRLYLKQSIKRIIKNKRNPAQYEIPYDLLKRIDFCLTDIPEDYAFVKKYLNNDIKDLWYNYYSVEETIGALMNSMCNGKNILIGNSSSLECNHLDGLRAIKKMNLTSVDCVYAPLSYGESWLRKEIINKGRRMLGQKFYPLTNFLPRDEYNKIIQSCSVAIMPHYRPQAFGNILTALWLGTRVYMSIHSQLFVFFKRIGTVVFSIEDDFNINNALALLPLSDDETEINRRIISSLYSTSAMNLKNKIIVQTLES